MCGIAGLYSLRRDADRTALRGTMKAMTDAIAHRGPDGDGLWQDDEVPALLLGQRRLAIIDLSPAGAQPMASHSGRYWCVYNGEIYNYQAIEAELRALGHQFNGRSDTEVFLAALDQWGLNQTFQKIIGMYAFIIWDRKERVLHFMRDRLGKKPLYIGWAGKDLVAGSELKVLTAHPHFDGVINQNTLALYMKYGFIQAPHTIYNGVWTLPPGARMTLKVSDLVAGENLSTKFEHYWDLQRVVSHSVSHRTRKSDTAVIAEFDDLLRLCVKERMISDVPLGAFLSGGIDSSTIVALMQAQSSRPVKTYTVGFEAEGYNEAPFAKDVAQHLGTDHHELYLTDRDALDVVPLLPSMYDEPFADISQIPTYLVSKFARHDVTVALSGDGGDEMLGGYNRHMLIPRLWARTKYMPQPVRRLMAHVIKQRRLGGDQTRKLVGAVVKRDPMAMYDYLLSANPGGEKLVKNGRLPPTPLTSEGRDLRGVGLPEHLMYKDTLSYLPDDVLVKVDRAAMAVSLEARAPLLDKRIAEYVWTLPPEFKIRGGQGKWLLRQVLKKYVPETMFERPKRGFTPPVDAWLRGGLKDWAGDLLSSERISKEGYLDAAGVSALWRDHQSGAQANGTQLWTILMFQAWLAGAKGSSTHS
jgi:asparagine synthase (glutamine-hydrolysing)